MQIHGLDTEAALASLNVTAAGLSASEAVRRRAEFGPNHIEKLGRESVLLSFAREFTHFFAIILWVGAALAILADHVDPDKGTARLGVAIVGVILVNGIFSFWQEYKAERAVVAWRQVLPQKVQALRAGEVVEVLAIDLVPGDIVLLEEGNAVPVDCRVMEAFGLRVNTATVTGESLPKARNAAPSTEGSALCAKNVLLAGTSVVSGQARAVVYATGMRTALGRIVQLTQSAGKEAAEVEARQPAAPTILPAWAMASWPIIWGSDSSGLSVSSSASWTNMWRSTIAWHRCSFGSAASQASRSVGGSANNSSSSRLTTAMSAGLKAMLQCFGPSS